jgi:hypothetical protein
MVTSSSCTNTRANYRRLLLHRFRYALPCAVVWALRPVLVSQVAALRPSPALVVVLTSGRIRADDDSELVRSVIVDRVAFTSPLLVAACCASQAKRLLGRIAIRRAWPLALG